VTINNTIPAKKGIEKEARRAHIKKRPVEPTSKRGP
jgi:hypothetical protein